MYKLAPHHATTIRSILIDKKILPSVCLAITKEIVHDEVKEYEI